MILCLACSSAKKGFYHDSAVQWQSSKIAQDRNLVHTLYLVGDAGELDDLRDERNYLLEALKVELDRETEESTLVYLGDNIYPLGLPDKENSDRPLMEAKINTQLEAASNFAGHTYFIPGNHDWMQGKKGGLKAIQRQEKYVESYYKEKNKVRMYPHDGCGDPEVKEISKDLVFVFVDSQWWLEDWTRESKMNRGCEIKSRGDFLQRMEEIFLEYKNDQIVVFMHHPPYSNGNHGSKFSLTQHLLPLNEVGIPLPLPVLGSIYPLYRSVTGSKQDIAHVDNQKLIQGILDAAHKINVSVIFASGHEHNLQYFEQDKLKFIVSGSGSKHTYTAKGGRARYTHEARGFSKISFYENQESWVEYYTVAGFDQKPVLTFRTQLFAPKPGSVDIPIDYPPIDVSKDTLVAANPSFAAGSFKEFMMGEQYRDIWTTPVKAQVIDLEKELGGLQPIQKGGGMASNSLRLEVSDGRNYALRSVNKDYTKLLPEEFGNLKVIDIMKDQNSASHPYGALVIPTLSKAAQVYYTSPTLVYLKHQRGLGNYNQLFPQELYLLEQRPSGNWEDFDQFGRSKDIVGYIDLLATLQEKKNHFVDQPWVLKSRMFDLFIHDWDRHDDQWRWASFDIGDSTIYRPIPRDRDQAFYKFVGVVPNLIATFFVKKFKTMKEDVKDVKNLSFNARYFDRYFLNDLEWREWQSIIEKLQSDLTDEVIENAMTQLPQQVQELNSAELAKTLIARREHLMEIGRHLYDYLSKEVEITGSDDNDLFEVFRHTDGTTQVRVFNKRDEKDDLLKFDRIFYPAETKEIRLYGLRGKDDFIVKGSGDPRINVRIIGGEDKDEVENKTESGMITAYDVLDGIKLEGKVRDKTSSKLGINDYDRTGFKYNSGIPTLIFGITPDDGFWLGGGYSWVTHGWRKDPFKTKQSLNGSLAPGSRNTFNLRYRGHFKELIGPIDFLADVHFRNPDYTNYFGIGNETVNPLREEEFHWVRMSSYKITPALGISSGNGNRSFSFGPAYHSIEVEETDGRVSTDTELGFSEDDFDRKKYLGFNTNFEEGFQDNLVNPTNGFKIGAEYNYWKLLDKTLDEYVSEFAASMRFYVGLLNKPKLVLASRLGYEKVFGDPQFYHYPSLGNRQNIRGFRNNRFRGASLFYQNIDLRMKVIKSRNNILPFDIGIVGGYDYGRVWVEGQDSDVWHSSLTAGLYFDLLSAAVIQPYVSFTNEETAINLMFGFNF
jgi:UDP-2,3-diacylglucosamine pyrophosphatase LpxH